MVFFRQCWNFPWLFKKSNLYFLIPIILLLFGLLSEAQSQKGNSSIRLTAYEKKWLSSHQVIRIAPDPYFPPIEWFDNDSKYRGIAADFVKLIQRETGINFKVIYCKDWDEVLRKAGAREVDALPAAAQTPERKKYLLYSDPHIILPGVIITRQKVEETLTMEQLSRMKVCVVKAYVWQEFIERDYPDINLTLVSDLQTGLKKVSLGIMDAMVATLPVAIYYIEKEGITNLRVAGETGYYTKLSFASRKDWPELNSIVKKALAKIPPSEKRAILEKWIHLHKKPLFKRKEFWISILVVVGSCGIIVFLIMFWNRSLRRIVNQRTEELKRELAQRMKAEEALKENEEKYRTMSEQSTDAIYITSLKGELSYINRSFLDLFGYTKEEVEDLKAQDFYVNPEDRFGFQQEVEKTGSVRDFEVKLRKKDGTEIDCLITANNRTSTDGSMLGYQGILRDITDRKRAEKALEQSEEKYRGLVENNFNGIFVQKASKIIFANQRLNEMLGYEKDELVGLDHWLIYHPDYQEITRKRAQARMRGEKVTHQYEVKL